MSDSIRQLYNAIDRFFDRGALSQELHFTEEGGGSNQPVTARQAFQFIQPVAQTLDPNAQITRIVSQHGLDQYGASAHWEFFFDLPHRRAKLVGEWRLPWEETLDDYGPAQVEVSAKPFPPMDSPLRKMVKEGQLLHQQLIGLWNQQTRGVAYLPNHFRDTDVAMADFIQQGLDYGMEEFSLTTGKSPQGKLAWIAEGRRQRYFANLVP